MISFPNSFLALFFVLFTVEALKMNAKQTNELNNDISSAGKESSPAKNSRIFFVKIAPPSSYSSQSSPSSSEHQSPAYHSSYSYSRTSTNTSPNQQNSIILNQSSSNPSFSSSISLSSSYSSSNPSGSYSSVSIQSTNPFRVVNSLETSSADSFQRRSDASKNRHRHSNSNLYNIPIKFVSNARPFNIKSKHSFTILLTPLTLWTHCFVPILYSIHHQVDATSRRNPEEEHQFQTL